MKRVFPYKRGFTLVELLIVIVVLTILAAISIVSYQNSQKRAAHVVLFKDLKSASEQLGLSYVKSPESFGSLDTIAGDMESSNDVILQFVTGYTGPYYENLSPVQEGVLFYDICKQLIADPEYSEIHSADGSATQSVVMDCDDSISDDQLQITGWDTKKWLTPLSRETIQAYITSVPYDDWWVDRQSVIQNFYAQMIQRFEASGGTFPIDSFWDPWANQWSGVPKEELPSPSTAPHRRNGQFCVEGYHTKFPDDTFHVTQEDVIKAGSC